MIARRAQDVKEIKKGGSEEPPRDSVLCQGKDRIEQALRVVKSDLRLTFGLLIRGPDEIRTRISALAKEACCQLAPRAHKHIISQVRGAVGNIFKFVLWRKRSGTWSLTGTSSGR